MRLIDVLPTRSSAVMQEGIVSYKGSVRCRMAVTMTHSGLAAPLARKTVTLVKTKEDSSRINQRKNTAQEMSHSIDACFFSEDSNFLEKKCDVLTTKLEQSSSGNFRIPPAIYHVMSSYLFPASPHFLTHFHSFIFYNLCSPSPFSQSDITITRCTFPSKLLHPSPTAHSLLWCVSSENYYQKVTDISPRSICRISRARISSLSCRTFPDNVRSISDLQKSQFIFLKMEMQSAIEF
ncbi:unnamed protein product [Onchocerca flexuosa]|uniref:Uncharacterized protein n=1 Tax=Onchocerca flexuosa TaxID=387005 RepID=A0A183H6T1_9BILA|nr:unnamed protein product [Onchocerca flexuosa]